MDESVDQSLKALAAFAQQDYRRSAQMIFPLLPRTTAFNLHLMLISLRRSKAEDALAELGGRCLEFTKSDAWEHALFRLTLGKCVLSDILDLATDDNRLCEAHGYAGSALLTEGKVEAARAEFTLCLKSKNRHPVQALAAIQLDWQGVVVNNAYEQIAALSRDFGELYQQERYSEALQTAKNAAELARSYPAIEPIDLANIIQNLATAYSAVADYHPQSRFVENRSRSAGILASKGIQPSGWRFNALLTLK